MLLCFCQFYNSACLLLEGNELQNCQRNDINSGPKKRALKSHLDIFAGGDVYTGGRYGPWIFLYTVKKTLAIFPFPVGMSLRKTLPLAGNNLNIPGRESLACDIPDWARENR
jgi:hypothetical protein